MAPRSRDPHGEDSEPALEIDLHGVTPEQALRRLGQGLHAAAVRGASRVLVITGKGLGNLAQKPILRGKVEEWLRGPEGQRAHVEGFARVHKGGALEVRLRRG